MNQMGSHIEADEIQRFILLRLSNMILERNVLSTRHNSTETSDHLSFNSFCNLQHHHAHSFFFTIAPGFVFAISSSLDSSSASLDLAAIVYGRRSRSIGMADVKIGVYGRRSLSIGITGVEEVGKAVFDVAGDDEGFTDFDVTTAVVPEVDLGLAPVKTFLGAVEAGSDLCSDAPDITFFGLLPDNAFVAPAEVFNDFCAGEVAITFLALDAGNSLAVEDEGSDFVSESIHSGLVA